VTDRERAKTVVHEVLLDEWPGRFERAQLQDDAELGKDGLELDSIEIVELVLICEQRFAAGNGNGTLLDAGPVSLGRLIDHFARSS
jgi:acyl carrier protein